MKVMTVGELRTLFRPLPASLEITVRGMTEDGHDFVGFIDRVNVEHTHNDSDTQFLAIDCMDVCSPVEPTESGATLRLVKS